MSLAAWPGLPAAGVALPVPRSLLAHSLVLAALLHVLVVLVFGNTPGGSARPGEGLWGAFQVRLTGPGPAAQADAAAPDAPQTGPPGQAERQRFGGTVRPEASARRTDGPGAAQAGRWLAQAADGDTEAPPLGMADLLPRQSVDAAALTSVGPAVATAPAVPLPPLPGFQVQPAPAPRDLAARPPARPVALPAGLDLPPAAPPALPSFATEAPPPARAVLSRPEVPSLAPLPAADLPAPSVPVPALPSFPLQAAPPPRTLAQRERSAPVGPVAAADLAAAPADALPLPNFTAQTQTPVPPRVVAARSAPSGVAAPALSDLAPASAERPALPSFAVAAPGPVAGGAAPSAASAVTPSAASATSATPATPAPSAAVTAALPSPTTAVAGAGPAPASPAPLQAASPQGAPQVAGAPDAGARVGHDIATAPSRPASAARLNLDLVRPRGGPIAARGSSGLLSVMPHPPELKTALEKQLDAAGLADCRKAYSAMGLAALAPLALDALREKGCRW